MDRPKCCQIDMEKEREGRRRRKKERKEEKNAKEEEMERKKEGESGRSGESVNNARFTKGRDGDEALLGSTVICRRGSLLMRIPTTSCNLDGDDDDDVVVSMEADLPVWRRMRRKRQPSRIRMCH